MAEANNSVQLAKLRTRLHFATITRARQVAMSAAKHPLKAQALKPTRSHREIAVVTEEYFAQHREELITEASQTVERWRAEGFFGKRARKT